MKQFSLEEYLNNTSRKVVTRDGRNVKILCTNFTKAQHIIAQIEGNDYSTAFHKDGIFVNGVESNYDLFFAPEKHEGWVNIYKHENLRILDLEVRKTKEEAKKWTNENCIATIKIEWEE